MCPKKNFGDDCPVCDFVSKLYNDGDDESRQLARKLVAKSRFFSPVVVRGEDNEGAKVWGYSKTVYENLLQLVLNPDYGDITDPMNGRDIAVEFKTAEEVGASFPKTSIRVKPNQTPITEDASLLQTITDNQTNITDIYNELSYEDLTEVLNAWLNPSEDEETEESAEETSNKTEAPKATEDVSSAFDDLFNK